MIYIIGGSYHQGNTGAAATFLYKRLPSSTIPMYKQVDECFKAENATVTSQKQMDCKKFNQFVEVNKTIFICKTTAFWLFQEGERIFIDCLFRVRSKQPYASSTSPSTISNAGNVKPITVIDDEVANVPQDVPCVAITEDKSECNALKSISKSWFKVESIALQYTDKQIILDGK